MVNASSMAIITWLLMKGTAIRSSTTPIWLLMGVGRHEKHEETAEGIMIKIGVAAVLMGYSYYLIRKLRAPDNPKPNKHNRLSFFKKIFKRE